MMKKPLPDVIFLIGMMGAGKSYWAGRLGEYLSFSTLDTDVLLEEKMGCSIAAFFEQHGEDAFRQVEKELLEHYPWPKKVVVACGGGLPCFFHNMETLLDKGYVIWLNPSLDELENRLLQEAEKRPLIAEAAKQGTLRLRLERLLVDRTPHYSKAHRTVTEVPLHAAYMLASQ